MSEQGGRPPVPIERKKKLGNPGKRALPEPIGTIQPISSKTISEPPEHLGKDGAAVWTRVAEFAAGWVGNSDLEALRMLAEAADRRAHLAERLATDGWVLLTDKGYAYSHPAAGMLATTETEMRKWMSVLGLTPADRSKLGVAEVKARSALEELAIKRREHLDKTRKS
jgi:P27 family predicted phage terminase small subunit